ncbi:hypothetical protein QQF64_000989 [Cirrhinus molitorella]|uniref:Uncharacterized protein n=1 Tax=Cirrhinus molitorella TaxID=172907 RepID=A0ABR3P056_9TELE
MTRSLTHYTFILSPLVFCTLVLKKSKGGWGVLGGVQTGKVCVYVCLCFALLGSALGLPACLPPLLLLLVWSPSKLYDLFSQRQRSKTPSDHRESSARGFNDFTTKMSAMAGAALSGTRRERDIQALTAHIHLLTDSRSYLGRLPNMDIKRKQEKTDPNIVHIYRLNTYVYLVLMEWIYRYILNVLSHALC